MSVRKALIATGEWSWKLVNVVINAGAVAAAAKIGTNHAEDLAKAFGDVIRWLDIAAKTLL